MRKVNKKTIAQIIGRKKRLPKRARRSEHARKYMANLIASFWEIEETRCHRRIKRELYKHFPIGGIACIEGWFRMAVADLINHGNPYRNNIKEYKDISLTIESVLAIQEQSVNIGELVAHFIKLRDLENIIGNLSFIIGKDFVPLFEATQVSPCSSKTVGEAFNKDAIFDGVEKSFELRHIFCHELASKVKYNKQLIENCLYNCFLFLIGADGAIHNLLSE